MQIVRDKIDSILHLVNFNVTHDLLESSILPPPTLIENGINDLFKIPKYSTDVARRHSLSVMTSKLQLRSSPNTSGKQFL